MEKGGLPHLYISKLGHEIEEIRLRALNHLTFKLEHKLISPKELAFNSELVKKLLGWFEFEPTKEEEKVINLLFEILSSNDDVGCYWRCIGVPSQIQAIRNKVSAIHHDKLDEILERVVSSESNEVDVRHVDFIPSSEQNQSLGREETRFAAFFEGEGYSDDLQQLSCPKNHSKNEPKKISSSSLVMVPWFPQQPLSPGDRHVLASVEHSLTTGFDKHVMGAQSSCAKGADDSDNDHEDTLIRCCQFIFDVILRDFLPEVFLQNPGIPSALLDLLSFLGNELGSGFADSSDDRKTGESLHWVLKCLQRLVSSLHSQLLFYADPSIPNHKDNSIIDSSQRTPSSCSIIGGTTNPSDHRYHAEHLRQFGDQLSLPSEDSSDNAAANFDSSPQFSLPRFCISILFQTFSLLETHLSGSHSRTFQSLMSLASLSVQLLSRIVDPSMWSSVNPSCGMLTGGISEILRVVGETLLAYQCALSQKEGDSTFDTTKSQCSLDVDSTLSSKSSNATNEPDFGSCRLAYLQVLFLTRSILKFAPLEPSLCRSALPKELSLALIIALYDPPIQLFCPELHADLLKFVRCVSPDAAKVCEQALSVANSVKMGIKVLKGDVKNLHDVDHAVSGLPFHQSREIVRKCWEYCCTVNEAGENNLASSRSGVASQIGEKSVACNTIENDSKPSSTRTVIISKSASDQRITSYRAESSKLTQNAVIQTKPSDDSNLPSSGKSDGLSTKRSSLASGGHYSEIKEAVISDSQRKNSTILKLLAHESCAVRRESYGYCWEIVKKLLGTASAKNVQSSAPGRECEGLRIKHLSFLWNRSVLTEIIVHGATCSDEKILGNARDIILLILKAKNVVSKKIWEQIIEALLPTLPLLQCLADPVTPLGKSITKMLDPDMSTSLGVGLIDVLRGNCRLLMNSEGEVRSEAAIRLSWMLSQRSQAGNNRNDEILIGSWKDIENRLPDADLLASSGPNTLANAFMFKTTDKNYGMRSHTKSSFSPDESESITQLLSLIGKQSDGNVSLSDARVRRSALNQLALMLEHNTHLHHTFLRNDGLAVTLRIFQGALVKDDYENYPDCAVPVISILKHLAHWNPSIRKELSSLDLVYHCILRATILFYGEEGFRSDAGNLLCLLLYTDYILLLMPCPTPLSTPPYTSAGTLHGAVASFKSLSLPLILMQRIHLPFQCASHWRHSPHMSSSPLSPELMSERSLPSPGRCLNWSIVGGADKSRDSLPWQGLIRLHGSWEWYGREGLIANGLRKRLIPLAHEDSSSGSSGFPALLKLSSAEVSDLKATDIIASCQSLLFQLQNATTHDSAGSALQSLTGYVSLWNDILEDDVNPSPLFPEGNSLPWSPALGRFLSRSPASSQDSELLVQICSFLRSAEDGLASKQIFTVRNGLCRGINWLEGMMQNPTTLQPLLCPFNPPPSSFPDAVSLTQAFDGCPYRRAVCREVLSLIRDVACCSGMNAKSEEVGWSHAIFFIAQSLQFGDAEHFYDLAFLEWALSCLVQLTGTPGWCYGVCKISEAVSKKRSLDPDFLWEGLISGLIELLTAFHRGGNSLPTWATEDRGPGSSENMNRHSHKNLRRSTNPSELATDENSDAVGSFMGLSITRSALLCLNHVLSGMQECCSKLSQMHWEMIWSKVLMNAGKNDRRGHVGGHFCGPMQGWLLPLWYSRDPVVRAASLQLAGGLVAISSPAHVPAITKNAQRSHGVGSSNQEQPLGLRLLEEGLARFPGGIWGTTLSFFLDHSESNLVREQAALLLTNLISASEKIPGEVINVLVKDGLLFQEIGLMASQLYLGNSLPQTALLANDTDGMDSDSRKRLAWSTPGLVQFACRLLHNMLTLKPKVVASAMWEDNGYLFRRLFGCIGKIPSGGKDDHMEKMLYVEVLGLYSEILSLLTSVIVWDTRLVALLPQPVPLASVFVLLNSKKYRPGNEMIAVKIKVWKKIFDFISASLGSLIDQLGKSFPAGDAAIASEKNYVTFLEAAYDSIIGNDPGLRRAALCSLNAIISFELQISMNQGDGTLSTLNVEGKMPPFSKLLQSPCMKHKGTIATPEASSRGNAIVDGDLTSGSQIAFKMCHLLIKLYEPDGSAAAEVSVALSSILALSVQAKYCALALGLMQTLAVKCRHLHVSIVMRESDESLLVAPNLPKGSISRKQKSKHWMKDMKLLFHILANFLHSGDLGNKAMETPGNSPTNVFKLEAVKIGFSDILHKLGTFSMLSTSLFLDFLQLLNTFTADCPPACQSLVHTSRTVGVGPRQNFAFSSLMHLLCELAPKQMDALLLLQTALMSKKGQGYNFTQPLTILRLILSVLGNTCDAYECRLIMAKGGLFRSLIKLHPSEKRINSHLVNAVEQIWLHFLLQFTAYPEGQLSIPKVPDMFELMLSLAKKPTTKVESFFLVLRNLALHPQNRARLLSSDDFLQLLIQVLVKPSGSLWHKEIAASTVWALSANNFKGKQILKSAGIDIALESALSFLNSPYVGGGSYIVSKEMEVNLKEDSDAEDSISRTSKVLNCALQVLGCEKVKRYSR